jgi:hypothetical protein
MGKSGEDFCNFKKDDGETGFSLALYEVKRKRKEGKCS